MDRPIRWGIVGCGRIARRFLASLAGTDGGYVWGVAGRDAEKAHAFAEERRIEHAYGDPDELLADPAIDAVYIALPHALHADWSIKALRAGKAVLCEKPAALSAAEMRGVIAAAKSSSSLYMEAMKARFVPLHPIVMDLAKGGGLGPVTFVDAAQCYEFPKDIAGYFVDPIQGGCLYDMGIYCISWLEELLPGSFRIERASALFEGGVDWYDNVQMCVGPVPVQLEVAADRGPRSSLHIECEQGSLDIPVLHRPQTVSIHRYGSPDETISAPYEPDDFRGEIEHFQQLLAEGSTESPIMPLSASLRCAEMVDAIRASWNC